MRTLFKFAAVVVFGTVLSGCGDEDFTGAYRFRDSSMKMVLVLNIHGDEAVFFGDLGKAGIKPLSKMKLSTSNEKLFLDDMNGSSRLVMKRNVDERSLDCLNCKVIGLKADELAFKYDPEGPYDVEKLLKEQERKDEEALNAALEKMQKEVLEKGRRDSEAQKLASFEGDWVYQRTTKSDPLAIMGIWRVKQVRIWSFKFETMDRVGYETPGFEVTDAGLKIGAGSSAKLYSLSADKKVLTCTTCDKPMTWVKADPKKDLSDRKYARQLAGNL